MAPILVGGAKVGVVGGIEVLPFGFLVFVAGSLLLANAWAVVDAKLAVEAAAREAGRAYVEAPSPADAVGSARRAARQIPGRLGARPRPDGPARQPPGLSALRRGRARGQLRQVPALSVPFIGGFGRGVTVHVAAIATWSTPSPSGIGGNGAC